MKITKIQIEKLFGYENNNYIINLINDSVVTFVYGFNGIGKSSVLKIINNAISNTDYINTDISFEKIILEFDSGESATIQQSNNKDKKFEINGLPSKLYCNYLPNIYDRCWKEPSLYTGSGTPYITIGDDILKRNLNRYLKNTESLRIIKEKINHFVSIINSENGLTDKELKIILSKDEKSIEKIYVESTFQKEKPLDIDKCLSIGEKNFLYLYFNLIFSELDYPKDKKYFIELIDEPEISLHPDLLIEFIENLEEIKKKNLQKNVQYLIATNSPAITFQHSDLMSEMRRENNA